MRDTVLFDTGRPDTDSDVLPSISSDDNLTAVSFYRGRPGYGRVYCSVSDGRGTSWSQPLAVDTGNGQLSATRPLCRVVDGSIYVAWLVRESDMLVFSRSTNGGLSFEAETALPTGLGPNGRVHIGADFLRMRFLTPTRNDLYIAIPIQDSTTDSWHVALISSHDAGLTWTSLLAGNDVTDFDIDVDPNEPMTVHVAWLDSGINQVDYQRSSNGGASFDGPEQSVRSSSGAGLTPGVSVAADSGANLVGILWPEETAPPATRSRQLQMAVSPDAGTSFLRDVTVVGQASGARDVIQSTMEALNGKLVLAWAAIDASLPYQLYAGVWDGGTSTLSSTRLSQEPAYFGPLELTVSRSENTVATTGSLSDQTAEIAFSTDGGTTWSNSTTYGSDGFVFESSIAFNPAYRNFIGVFSSVPEDMPTDQSPFRIRAGGFRIPTLNLVGWDDLNNPANTQVSFTSEGFAADPLVAVLISTAPGPSPVPDGRLIDIGPANLSLSPQVLMILNGAGSGMSVPTSNPFAGTSGPNSLTLYFAAIGGGVLEQVSNITDTTTSVLRF